LLALLLPLLLAVTTPTGTGAGLHIGQLLHPLFNHVHVVNGQVVSHEGMPHTDAPRPPGVALGAASGANPAGGDGAPIGPTPLLHGLRAMVGERNVRLEESSTLPRGLVEPPPDPPPTRPRAV
jgi:hypothetical protein